MYTVYIKKIINVHRAFTNFMTLHGHVYVCVCTHKYTHYSMTQQSYLFCFGLINRDCIKVLTYLIKLMTVSWRGFSDNGFWVHRLGLGPRWTYMQICKLFNLRLFCNLFFELFVLAEDADNVEEESSPSDTGKSVPRKLTRAQRKRIRKRKLKEAASVRRKIVGPLLPTAYQNLEDGP